MRAGERLPFAIEVIAFGDEEGVRFPSKLTGSRAVAGTFEPQSLDITDQQGVHLEAALRAFGCDPAAIPDIGRRREQVLGYVEVHIEQGPVLEQMKLPVGIVSAIAGASRFRIEVVGEAGHAGTVPMELRKDALAAAAEMILAVERRAHGAQRARPGRHRGCGRGVAGRAQRDPRPGHLHARHPRARSTPTGCGRSRTWWPRSPRSPRAAMSGFEGREVLRRAGRDLRSGAGRGARGGRGPRRVEPHRLPSGAGHDGLAIAALCPIAMLFVRCKGGISHNPAESITTRDADVATRVLLDFLRHFRGAADVSRPLWLRDPLAILAEGDAAGGIVVADGRIVELVPRGRQPEHA